MASRGRVQGEAGEGERELNVLNRYSKLFR
jgi:hypothetical protein